MSRHTRVMGGLVAVACVAALLWFAFGRGRQQTPAPAAGTLPSVPVSAPEQTPERYALVTTLDSGVEGLKGIALDAQDRLYAAGALGIRVLDAGGALVREWSVSAPATCVAVDANGNVYVGSQSRVEAFDPEGKPLRAWGEPGRGRGELYYVTALAVAGPDVLVADAGNRCIHRFDLTGDFIDEIGTRDAAAGLPGLVCPSPYLDLAIDSASTLHVTNPGLWHVERYSLDGKLMGAWGESGTRPEQFTGCCNPTNIALRADGAVVVAEKATPRVKVYDAGGALLAFLGPEHFTMEAAGLDIAIDSTGRLFVADPGDGRIRIFERTR
jgi:DNA-binding beta-propeller fold protein YncE